MLIDLVVELRCLPILAGWLTSPNPDDSASSAADHSIRSCSLALRGLQNFLSAFL
ncbi:hypothetical protein SynPROS91_01435 [Synechococcus sp. PROS-9-1]|nr:hypothetical protein SynPROS91_01435 [Synechococcus sp. PROS-9-1]